VSLLKNSSVTVALLQAGSWGKTSIMLMVIDIVNVLPFWLVATVVIEVCEHFEWKK
jgi:hypothetical protein